MLTKLTTQSELPAEGEAREFPCGDKVICIANVNGTISAMDNVCLHRGGPLGQGVIEGDKLVCPWHGWQWNTKTGEAVHNTGSLYSCTSASSCSTTTLYDCEGHTWVAIE